MKRTNNEKIKYVILCIAGILTLFAIVVLAGEFLMYGSEWIENQNAPYIVKLIESIPLYIVNQFFFNEINTQR